MSSLMLLIILRLLKKPLKEGVVADLYKRVVKVPGQEPITIYELLDKKGNKLSSDLLDFVDQQF